MLHELKIKPDWFRRLESCEKKAEFRKADRDFQTGDEIQFNVLGDDDDGEGSHPGRFIAPANYRITHVIHISDFLATEPIDFVVLSLERVKAEPLKEDN